VDYLSPKTRVQSYYEHDYEDFLAVLKKNKKKLQLDPARPEPAEALRERIAATDRLIDAVVYRLYGLSEEEIGIVEGRAERT
jgi:crotonobetainyl-CoA:carnitine CoA-transferase CaiB-like acyl-CoA transferase